MAKDTAKKNMRRNESRMRAFTIITWGINALSLLCFVYSRGSIPYFRDLSALTFWASHEFAALFLLKKFAKPTFSSTGELLDCPDASNPQELGVYSLAQDVLWWCWVVQFLCCVFHWAFVVLYLPIPGILIYKAWVTFLGPLLRSRHSSDFTGSEETEAAPRNRAERRRQELLRRKGKN